MVPRRTVVLAFALAMVVFSATAALYHQRLLVTGDRDVVVDFERAYEGGMISEFNNRERLEGSFYRWTKAVSYVDFHNLPTSGTLVVEARLRVRRPHGEPLPNLAFTANGATVHTSAGRPSTETYRFEFPATRSHVRLGIRSDTFDPSGTRPLGVQVLDVTVDFPDEPVSWVAPASWMAGAAALLFAVGIVATAGRSLVSAGAALVVSAGFLFLLAQHALRYSLYPRQILALAAFTLLIALIARRLQPDARVSVTTTIAVVFLVEMAVAFYPLTLTSDARFSGQPHAALPRR